MSVNEPIPSAPSYIDLSYDQQPEGHLRYSEQPGYAPLPYHVEIIDEQKELKPTTLATITINTTTSNSDIDDEANKIIHFEPEGVVKKLPIPSYIPIPQNKNINLICKSLHESLGLFKSKSIRIKTFKKIILNTTKKQRKTIRNQYYIIYKTRLNRVIRNHFSGALRELLLYSFMTNDELIAISIEYALKYKNIKKLSYILCTLDNKRLKSVQHVFNRTRKNATKTLKVCIGKMTTNLFHQRNIGKYLLNILECKRRNSGNIDMKTVKNDVKKLYKHLKHANIQNLNKELLVNMFANRSFDHLYYISLKYEQKYNVSLVETIREKFKVGSETGYAILVTLNYSINKYMIYGNEFAKDIHQNSRNNYCAVLRFIILHYDYDLKNIIDYYGEQAMRNWIKLELKKNDIYDTVFKLCGLN